MRCTVTAIVLIVQYEKRLRVLIREIGCGSWTFEFIALKKFAYPTAIDNTFEKQ